MASSGPPLSTFVPPPTAAVAPLTGDAGPPVTASSITVPPTREYLPRL